jgi:hypothetical protein
LAPPEDENRKASVGETEAGSVAPVNGAAPKAEPEKPAVENEEEGDESGDEEEGAGGAAASEAKKKKKSALRRTSSRA